MRRKDDEAAADLMAEYAHPSAGFRERVTETEVTETRTTVRYKIPYYGFIERLEISPKTLLPNMDAGARPYTAEIHLYGPDGQEIPVLIEAVYRNIRNSEDLGKVYAP